MSDVVAVRALCEFTARTGDIDLRNTPAPSALEGIAGHILVQGRRGPDFETEVALAGTFEGLSVRGRADGFDPLASRVEEIKTYRGRLDAVRPHHRALHWAQAKVYAHLLCASRGLARIQVALVYFNIATEEETALEETYEASALRLFFETLCARYLRWSRSEAMHRKARDAALEKLPFPLQRFRCGQRDLAVAVYRSVQSGTGGQCLLAQAPTGIGKTLGTLFPMLKASTGGRLDKVFFLTAKGTGRGLAQQALATIQLRLAGEAPSFQLRVLDLRARDKACEHPGKACHGDSCPLARGFYDRLPLAREAATRSPQPWDASSVRSLALAHEVCPYYLAQELVRWSDVVVADYHYYYDNSAILHALTQAQQWKVGVLVDEAHNLVERARRMYTAELSQLSLTAARKRATGTVRKALDRLQRAWSTIHKTQRSAYQAHEEIPAGLLGAVQRAVAALSEAFADGPMLPGDPLPAFYWEALAFIALAEQMGGHALFDVSLGENIAGRARPPACTLCIRNVVPAPHLAARHAAAHATVLFSGTLRPAQFYRDMLGLPAQASWLQVEGPFHAGQLEVQVAAHVSTRYRDRDRSVQPIAELVAQQFAKQPGNYLCFFSSFEYMQCVAQCLQAAQPEWPIWQQTRALDEAGRNAFLARFAESGQGIGFAVLGGVFSEGVDLPGKRLIGAFVATLGLPQVNPINERMKHAMDKHFGGRKGYDYTYLYPGLRKVVQAAGRVIRAEEDSGFLCLIDDRFRRADVRALLPAWWQLER
jgi:DNA excision repair protein ERCC-2